ncbi:MAG: ABC transporter ATP-binding protein, partial [Peptostreptococcus porci]|nr:ABC transporter ATP-binding protein [Peptostreptococcus porci]
PGISRGFVFQNYALFPWLTIRKNIEFPLKEARLSKDAIRTRADELLNLAGLRSHENQYPHEISGGMKQRTALIRALANKPKVLLMDEPLGALDMRMRQNLQSEIQSIWMKEKTTVIMVTHDVDEAVYMSDRIILMTTNNGKIEMDIRVNLARPRNRDGQEYMKIVRLLTNKLNEDL